MTKLVWDKTGRWVTKDKWVRGVKVEAPVAEPVAPEKPKRVRRTKAQIAADKLAAGE